MLPEFAYGLTLVQNEATDARSLLDDIRRMRDLDIPCDTMGLEPSWMETFYDYTVYKKWNKKRFELPSWYEENSAQKFTFFYPMREMGMKLSLWLCNDYRHLLGGGAEKSPKMTITLRQNRIPSSSRPALP